MLGNLLTYTDFNGNTTKYEYDSHGRIIAKTFPDGSKVTYKYTPSGNIMSVTDKNGTISYSYDSCDRLLKQTNADGSIVSYTYDAAGNKTSVTVDAAVTKYEYDALNRLTQVTDNNGGITKYSYDKAGNRIGATYPNGVVTEYNYDALNRLIKVTNKNANSDTISSYTYTLGKAGNRIKVTDNTGRTVDYTYDNIYRLTDEKVTDSVSGNSEISYTYDKTANRLTETKNGSTTKYTYDADDRLLTDGNTTYTYDKNGNLLTKVSSDETDSYKYDYENHMVQARIAKGGNTTNEDYTYDANGVRTSKTVNGTDVTSYITDNNTEYAKVLEEKDNDGKVKVAYTYGDDLISQVRNGKTSYYVYDGKMSVRFLTDETGKVTDTYTYDAFGNLTNKTGSTENDFLYTGQQYDANTGFYNLRARYYNPANGRFTSMDTYAGDEFDPLTLHKYVYCSADPVDKYDPSGHDGDIATLSGDMSIAGILARASETALGILNNIRYAAYAVVGAASRFVASIAEESGETLLDVENTIEDDVENSAENTVEDGEEANVENQDSSLGDNSGENPDPKKPDDTSSYRNYSAKQIEKKYDLGKGEFHKIKQDIISEAKKVFPKQMKKVGDNPDIHLDDSGLMRIVSRIRKYSFPTYWNIDSFLP